MVSGRSGVWCVTGEEWEGVVSVWVVSCRRGWGVWVVRSGRMCDVW